MTASHSNINNIAKQFHKFIYECRSYYIFLIFLVFCVVEVRSICNQNQGNCQTCFDNNRCLICKQHYRIGIHLLCRMCQTNGCAKCFYADYSCNGFINGVTYIDATPCSVPNCADCRNSPDICYICKEGFKMNSQTSCQACSKQNCKTCTTTVSTCTSCKDGYKLSGGDCVSCGVDNCQTCSTIGQCSTCLTRYGLTILSTCLPCTDIACKKCDGNVGHCDECQLRFGLKGHNCQRCTDTKCVDCSLDKDYCNYCQWQANLTMVGGQCVPCPDINCKDCRVSSNVCRKCTEGYGVDNNYRCQLCSNSPSYCQNCTATDYLNCTSCPTGRYLNSNNNLCLECPSFCLSCVQVPQSLVQCNSCFLYFYLMGTPQLCYSICGDLLIAIDEQCDNQLQRAYDGCSDLCLVQSNFICFNINKSVCSYIGTILLEFNSILQASTFNNFIIKVKIWPPLYIFSITRNQSLKQLFRLQSKKILSVDKVSYNNQSNLLQFQFQINQSIASGETINVNFMPSNMRQIVQHSLTNDQSIVIVLKNHIIFYSQFDIYILSIILYMCYGLSVICWISFIVGVVLRKLAGLEAMSVFQMAYIILIHTNSPLLMMFKQAHPLKFTTGYNLQLIEEDLTLSRKQADYPYLEEYKLSEMYLVNNFNLNLVLELCLFVVLGVMYCRLRIFLKQVKLNQNQQKNHSSMTQQQGDKQAQKEKVIQKQREDQQKLIEETEKFIHRYQIAWQLIMNAVMVNLTFFVACSNFFFQFGFNTYIPSLVIFALQIVVTLITLGKFFFDPSTFDYFRFSFKISVLAMHHYFFHIFIIILTVFLLTMTSLSYIPLIPVTIMLIYTIIYRPYKETADNIRSILNMLVVLSFLMFRVYVNFVCKCSTEQQFFQLNVITTKLFYLSNLCSLFIVAIVAIFISAWQSYRDNVQQKKLKKQQTQMGHRKMFDRRSLLAQLVRIDPNSKMSNLQIDNTFKRILDPNKSLLIVTRQTEQTIKMEESKVDMSNQKLFPNPRQKISAFKTYKREINREKARFHENRLCEQDPNQKASKQKERGQEINVATEIIRSENIYINLEASMRAVRKVMETEDDLTATIEYDKIDANFHLREVPK